jgi:phosphatidate cytidylyltransferase
LPPASPLWQRTLTALALGPLVLAGALWLPTGWLAVGLALVVVLGAWEWTALAGLEPPSARFAYLGVVALGCAALWQAQLWGWGPYLLIPVALGWLLVLAYLARVVEIPRAQGVDLGLLAVGLPVMLGPWLALVYLDAVRPDGPVLVLFLLLLIWGADIAAYFAGRRWGRAKLAPVLSPGKTWAGGYGALAAAVLCGMALAWLLGVGAGRALALIAICILTAVVSVAGDLFESLLKRRRGLKDSGRLLPGHGGVLDRIDSMTAAAPVFALGLHMLL